MFSLRETKNSFEQHPRRKPAKNVYSTLNGQAAIEFVFCMIIVLLMMYGTIMIFRWSGVDLAERRMAHDKTLRQDVAGGWGRDCEVWWFNPLLNQTVCNKYTDINDGPFKQLDPFFYRSVGMNAVWKGPINL